MFKKKKKGKKSLYWTWKQNSIFLSCKLWSILELFGNEHGSGIWQNTVPPNCDNISAFSCQVQTSVSSFHFSVENFCLSFVHFFF